MEESTQQYTNISPEQPSPSANNHRRLLVIAGVAVAVMVLLLIAVMAMRSRDESKKDSVESTAVVSAALVDITAEGFNPSTIKVSKGQSVEWTNKDTSSHQIASDPHPLHDGLAGLYAEEPLEPNETYGYTFSEPGTYTYHDHLNPLKHKGTVVVE